MGNENLLQKIGAVFSGMGSRKLLAIIGFIIILIAVPLIVFLSGQRQDIRQRASNNTDAVTQALQITDFTVNGRNFSVTSATAGVAVEHQKITTGNNSIAIDHKFDYFQYYQVLTPDYLRNAGGPVQLRLEGGLISEKLLNFPVYPSFASLQIEYTDTHETLAHISNTDIWNISNRTFTVAQNKSIVVYIRAMNARASFSGLKLVRLAGSSTNSRDVNIWGGQSDDAPDWTSGRFHNAANDVRDAQPTLYTGTVIIEDNPTRTQVISQCISVDKNITYKVTGSMNNQPNLAAPYLTFAGIAIDELQDNCTHYAGRSYALNQEFKPQSNKIGLILRAWNNSATFSNVKLEPVVRTAPPTATLVPLTPSLSRCTNVNAPVPSTQGVVGISKVSYPDCNSNINAAMQQIVISTGSITANNAFQEIPISTGGNGLGPGQQHTLRLANIPAGYGVGYTVCDMTRAGQCRTNPITTVNISGGTGSFNVEVPGSQSVVDVVLYLAPPSAVPPTVTPVPPTATSIPPTATRVPPTNTPIPTVVPTKPVRTAPVTLAPPTATPTSIPTGSISANQTTCSVSAQNAVCTIQITANATVPYIIYQNGRLIHAGQPNVQAVKTMFVDVGRTRFAVLLTNGTTELQSVDVNVTYTPLPTNTPTPLTLACAAATGTFAVGDTIPFTASGTGAENGRLSWSSSTIQSVGASNVNIQFQGRVNTADTHTITVSRYGTPTGTISSTCSVNVVAAPTATPVSQTGERVRSNTAAAPTATSVPAPTAPTNVVASPGCNGRGPGSQAYISITWTGPGAADSYDVSTSDGAVVITGITDKGSVSNPYIFTNAAYNGNQFFKVRSSRSGVKSAYTNSNTINQPDCTQPAQTATNTPIPPTTAPTTATVTSCTRTQGGYRGSCVASATITDDLFFWIQEVQKSSPSLTADYNGDGKVNTLDFNIWSRKRYP